MKAKHIDPALESARRHEQNNPYENHTELTLGKVINVHPDTGKIDVAIDGTPHQGGIIPNVPVMSWSYATQTGQSYLPSNIKLAAPIPSSQGTFDQPIPSGEQDVWCVLGFLDAKFQRPVCIGFLSPLDAQIHTKDAGWEVSLHESGVWMATDPAGNTTMGLPDGSTIVIGQSITPANMTAQNANWKPQTTNTPYNLTMNIKGNVNITVNGSATVDAQSVYLGTSTGSGNAVAYEGATVQVDTVTGAGTITQGSTKVFTG
jgi:hypothetical protein